jgi:hypothetical protein
MAKLEEGILKTLTAPLRRRKLIKKVEASADKHRENRDSSNAVAGIAYGTARKIRQNAKNINYFDPKHDEAHKSAKNIEKTADEADDRAAKSGRMASKRSRTALNLVNPNKKSKALGANKGLKEEMNPIKAGIKDIQEGKLEQMREKFNDSLARKAAEALQEKKLEVASNYFGQK